MATCQRNKLDLTPMQNRILAYTVRGLCMKLIARESGLALGTVKAHTAAAFQALGVNSRAQAICKVAQLAGADLASWVEQQRH